MTEMGLNYDPRLKAAMKQIEEIMDLYDIGGFVSLASKSHAEYKLHLPSWSVASWEPIEETVPPSGKAAEAARIVIKHRVATKELTDYTFHLLLTCRDTCNLMARNMQALYLNAKKVLNIEHKTLDDLIDEQGILDDIIPKRGS